MPDRPRTFGPALLAALLVVALGACTAEDPAAHRSGALDEAPPPELTEEQPDLGEPQPDDVSHPPEKLREVPFPVLLLPDRFAEGVVITSGTVWYAMSYDSPRDITVSIHATNQVHMTLEGEEVPPPNSQVRGVPAYTGVEEGIRSITWENADVAYVVEVECWNVFEDPRCTEPDFVRKVAEDLVELPR